MVSFVHMLVLQYSCTVYKLEQYLDGYYMLDKYIQAYECQTCAMLGPNDWPNAEGADEIFPSNVRVQPGRIRKARRKALDEPINPYKISRNGYVVKCGNYGGQGHNYKSCSLLENLNRKRWKPRKQKGNNTFSNVSITFSIIVFYFPFIYKL
jgi:hypothetical protein